MKIQEITIHNWRSIRDLTISCGELVIFIGQNNHGKSNILSAILFFFGEITCNELDFYNKTEELFVEITFSDLDDHDRLIFKKYLSTSKTIRVRKKANIEGTFSYHGYKETPEEDWLREENITKYLKREDAEQLPLFGLLPTSGRITKDDFLQAQELYIEAERGNLVINLALEAGPFLGAKNVAKGIFGDIYFIPSIKKAEDDFSTKGRSVFSSLYSRVINKISATDSHFKEAKEKISSLMLILNKVNEDGTENTLRPSELTSFEKSLQAELKNWNTKIDVEITPPDIDDIFRVGATVWVDDGFRTDVGRKGQGLQRALIFGLMRTLAIMSRQNLDENKTINETEMEVSSRKASESIYFILEEPELCLHPQAQRELFDSILQLSKAENQVFLCTHSSSFISLEQYRSIYIVRKNNLDEGTTVFQCKDDLFPNTNDKNYFNLIYWINPDRGELFFARKVVLIEGPTEKTVLPLLAQRLNLFRHDYTLIDCGSKDCIPNYLQLLNNFKIPYVVVYDLDHQAGKSSDAIASADKSSERIEELINNDLGKSVVLVNDIEEEIGINDLSCKHKPYIALTHIESTDFIFSASLHKKIKEIYS